MALQAQDPVLLPSSSSLDKQGEWILSQAIVAKCCWNESMRQAMHKESLAQPTCWPGGAGQVVSNSEGRPGSDASGFQPATVASGSQPTEPHPE